MATVASVAPDGAGRLRASAACRLPATALGAGRATIPSLSIELVDPKVLRVCADPHNLPFSNEKGEGFENKIAELFAEKLDKSLAYTWFPQSIGFVRNTLNAHKCDVIMGFPQGGDLAQSTNPYYRTAYALVFKPRQRARRHRHAVRPAPEGQADRRRRRHAARDLPGDERPPGQREGLSAGGRHAGQFLGRGDDQGPGSRARSTSASCGGRWPATTRKQAGADVAVVPLIKETGGPAARLPHHHGRARGRPGMEAAAQPADPRATSRRSTGSCWATACRCSTTRSADHRSSR